MKKYKNSILKVSGLLLVALTFLSACKKDPIDWYRPVGEPMSSYVKFINALPNSRLDFYAYTAKVASGISYGDTVVPYAKTPYGNIIIYGTNFNNTSNRISATTSAVTPQMNGQGLVANFYQTMFACKTTDSTSAETMILLRDNLAAPASGQAHIRFVHLGQRGSTSVRSVDFSIVGKGVKFANNRYQVPSKSVRIIPASTSSPGTTGFNTPNLGIYTSGPFEPEEAGTYTFEIKEAGTENVLTSKTITLASGKIYTFYTIGIMGGSVPFELKVLAH